MLSLPTLSSIHSYICRFLPGSYIFMLYVAEQPELPIGPFGMDERLKRTIQLLDGNFLLGLLINGRTKWKNSDQCLTQEQNNHHHLQQSVTLIEWYQTGKSANVRLPLNGVPILKSKVIITIFWLFITYFLVNKSLLSKFSLVWKVIFNHQFYQFEHLFFILCSVFHQKRIYKSGFSALI